MTLQSFSWRASIAGAIGLLSSVAALAGTNPDAPVPAPPPEFTACAKPDWPQEVVEAAPQGRLMLAFFVSPDGRPLDSKVVKSSGIRLLDKAAMNSLWHCRLEPSVERGANGRWYHVHWSWILDGTQGKWNLDSTPVDQE